eukprot:ANDGO_05112.mRNA.1 hypothetical protein
MATPSPNQRRHWDFYYDNLRFGSRSAVFSSSSPRLSPVVNNGVPPPGAYDVPSTIRPSSASPSSAGSKHSPKHSFGGTSQRFIGSASKSFSDVPGPGAYTPPTAFSPASLNRASNGDGASRSFSFSPNTSGAQLEKASSPLKKAKSSSAFMSTSPRLASLSDGKASTDPGLYDVSSISSLRNSRPSSAAFKTTLPRGLTIRDDAPPPGAYDPRDAFCGSAIKRRS